MTTQTTQTTQTPPDGVQVTGSRGDRYDEVLTGAALAFLADLHRTFDARRLHLLQTRAERYEKLAAGNTLDFLPETLEIRNGDWKVAPPAPGLVDRRVEITGPTDAKMTINALNSGAKIWLADLEDASTPAWANVIEGQLNLRDALDRTIDFTSPEGKAYALGADLATIVVRPRGWHLPEKHILVDGQPMSGSLVDFGLYLFHCAQRQIDAGKGPYFYLPKLESHHEARLWNDVFLRAQESLGIPAGTIRATVLIETYPAAFEMEEILYELRQHSSGLNAGRWDYIFSVIKKFRTRGRGFMLPDRAQVTMTVPFMHSYSELLLRTCHKRGAHAIGGMAAFIPSKDPKVNDVAFAKVEDEKTREARAGFDGSWVAHPGMVEVCRAAFTGVLGERPNQLDKLREDIHVTAEQLLDVSATPGQVTEVGLRANISVGIQYLASWLRGSGAVAIFNLMEDTATAEISRSQVWQWLHNHIVLADSEQVVTRELVERIVDEEIARLPGEPADYAQARATFVEVAIADDFAEFLTLPAYERMP
jgi:malate synthase